MSAAGQQIVGSIWPGEFCSDACGVVPGDRPPPVWPQDGDGGRSPALLLARAIRRDVVPRLILPRHVPPDLDGAEIHRAQAVLSPSSVLSPSPVLSPSSVLSESSVLSASVEEFAALVIARDAPPALAYAARAAARGTTAEALYLELLAPTARHLGELWNEDLVDFTAVTIGLGRLHLVMRDLSPVFQRVACHPESLHRQPPHDQRALLVAVPGEQHTFGLAMVTEFLRRAAWTVWNGGPASGAGLAGPDLGSPDLVRLVRDNWFALVGISLGYEGRLEALRTLIRSLRQASRNPRVGFMVGGPVFTQHPEFVAQIGADAMAADGPEAVIQAQRMLQLVRVGG